MAHLRESVLHALSDPTHPDLPANLLLAAGAVTDTPGDVRLWLQGGLFTHLIHILRTLPTLRLAPTDAAELCAAAAAVLANTMLVAGYRSAALPSTAHSLQDLRLQLRSPDILAVVITHGMLAPAAVQPLITYEGIHMQVASNCSAISLALAGVAVQFTSAGFWTPLRVCGFLLQEVLSGVQPAYTPAQTAVLGRLADARVFTHLLQTTLECPVDMPWMLIRQVALCNEAAAVASVGQLLPALRLVLRKQQELWDSAPPCTRAALAKLAEGGTREMVVFTCSVVTSCLKATLGRSWLVRFISFVASWVWGMRLRTGEEMGLLAFSVELVPMVLDFTLAWQQALGSYSEAGAAAWSMLPPSDFMGKLPKVITACLRQLRCTATNWEGAREGLVEPLLQQGMLLRWLRAVPGMEAAAAEHVLELADRMLTQLAEECAGTAAHGWRAPAGGQAAAGRSVLGQGLAVEFLEGLVTEAYPALKWCIDSGSPTHRDQAIALLRKAISCSGTYMRCPKEEVLDGIALLLEDVAPWCCVCRRQAPAPAAAAARGQAAAEAAQEASNRVCRQTLLPILFSDVCRDALAPVVPYICWLAVLAVPNDAHVKHRDPQRAAAHSHCLLAIGDHIYGGPTQGHKPERLWDVVAATAMMGATEGSLLASQYSTSKEGREKRRAQGRGPAEPPPMPPLLSPLPRTPLTQRAHYDAIVVAMQLLSHHDPRGWWGGVQTSLRGFLVSTEAGMRQAVEEAMLAGIFYITAEHPVFDSWPRGAQEAVAGLLNAVSGPCQVEGAPSLSQERLADALAELSRPYQFTEQALQVSEPARMDLWLLGAALWLLGTGAWHVGVKWDPQGWRHMREWSLEYARGSWRSRAGGVQMERRRALRFACMKAIARAFGPAMPPPPGLARPDAARAFCERWLEELQEAERGGARGPGQGPTPSAAETGLLGSAGTNETGVPHSCRSAGDIAPGCSAPASSAPVGAASTSAVEADGEPSRGSAAAVASTSIAAAPAAPAVGNLRREHDAAVAPEPCDRQCAQCGGQHEELLVCSGCMGIKYCSAKCQKAHWKQHRKDCKRVQRERQVL